jgi:hypothetical protein
MSEKQNTCRTAFHRFHALESPLTLFTSRIPRRLSPPSASQSRTTISVMDCAEKVWLLMVLVVLAPEGRVTLRAGRGTTALRLILRARRKSAVSAHSSSVNSL